MKHTSSRRIVVPAPAGEDYSKEQMLSVTAEIKSKFSPKEIADAVEWSQARRIRARPVHVPAELAEVPHPMLVMANHSAGMRSSMQLSPFNAAGSLYSSGYSMKFVDKVEPPKTRIGVNFNNVYEGGIIAEKEDQKIILPICEGSIDTSFCAQEDAVGMSFNKNYLRLCITFATMFSVTNDRVTRAFQFSSVEAVMRKNLVTRPNFEAMEGGAQACFDYVRDSMNKALQKQDVKPYNLAGVDLANAMYKVLMLEVNTGSTVLVESIAGTVNTFFVGGSQGYNLFTLMTKTTKSGEYKAIRVEGVKTTIPTVLDGEPFSRTDATLTQAINYLAKCRAIRGQGDSDKTALAKTLIGKYDVSDEMQRILGIQYQFGKYISESNHVVVYGEGDYRVSALVEYLKLTQFDGVLTLPNKASIGTNPIETVIKKGGTGDWIKVSERELNSIDQLGTTVARRNVIKGTSIVVQRADVGVFLKDNPELRCVVIDVGSTWSATNNNAFNSGFKDNLRGAISRMGKNMVYFVRVGITDKTYDTIAAHTCVADVHLHNMTGWITNVRDWDSARYVEISRDKKRYIEASILSNASRTNYFMTFERTYYFLKRLINHDPQFDYTVFDRPYIVTEALTSEKANAMDDAELLEAYSSLLPSEQKKSIKDPEVAERVANIMAGDKEARSSSPNVERTAPPPRDDGEEEEYDEQL